MSRNITDLHPRLQVLCNQLVSECEKQGIKIRIGECFRTVDEQNELYAKGRTAPGSIVTNARGTSYSSMHQWGVAFDFFLNMDIDGDGAVSDDAFNNSTRMFNKVGAIGVSLGLEWGGNWKSIVDTPHFQLPDWGSTASKLKSTYGTPDEFKKTWGNVPTPAPVVPKPTPTPAPAPVTTSLLVAKGTVKKGSKGTNVALLQFNLNCVINAGLTVDGIAGSATDKAIRTFQKNYGLSVDGIYGANSHAKMMKLKGSMVANATIKKGSKGTNVKVLQNALNFVINAGLKVDGDAGSATANAIKTFQNKYGLSADGIYGAKSEAKMRTI